MENTKLLKGIIIALSITTLSVVGGMIYFMTSNKDTGKNDDKNLVETTSTVEPTQKIVEETQEPVAETQEPDNVTESTKKPTNTVTQATKKPSSNNTSSDTNRSGRIRVVCKALNCAVDFPEELQGCIKVGECHSNYNNEFKSKEESVNFSGKIDNCESYLFTINKLKGKFTKKQIEETYAHMRSFIGVYDGYTYSYSMVSEATEEQVKYFGDYINKEILNIKDHFEYLK